MNSIGKLEKFLLIVSTLFSFLGGILLLTQDFGGWSHHYIPQKYVIGNRTVGKNLDWYNQNVVEDQVIINVLNEPILGFFITILSFTLLYCCVISFLIYLEKKQIDGKTITMVLLLSLMVFVFVIVGSGLIMFSKDVDTPWLGPGSLGGAGGSLFTFLIFLILLKKYKTKLDLTLYKSISS